MQCPECKSEKIVKNGRRKDKQNYLCRDCDRQFIDVYDQRGYSAQTKKHCLTLYCNGLGFRAIERATGVSHNTVINWVKQAAAHVPEENYEIPETAQIDELQTFVGSKSGATPLIFNQLGNAHQDKNKVWLWTVVNSHQAGILKWTLGDRSQKTFCHLWSIIRGWCCFLSITDGWKVYPCCINQYFGHFEKGSKKATHCYKVQRQSTQSTYG